MNLASQLSSLESAGLIQLARAEPDLEYLFRHALVQDAAYDSLLRSERLTLHRAAGEALEELYHDRLDEIAPRLGEHFWQAGDNARALVYFRMAAENAARGYANSEAIELYSRALQAAGQDRSASIPLLQARGSLFDVAGDFERSRGDQEAALAAARDIHDPVAEWQSLVNLGFLWSSRDYTKTGEYYRQAITLARPLNDRRMLAHSLNWLGNFQVNSDDPLGSRTNHTEALGIFEELGDEAGIAETYDLLGMSLAIGGDLIGGADALDRAQMLYRKIGQVRGLASVLATHAMVAPNYQTDTMVHPPITVDDAERLTSEGLRLAVEAGWPSGVIYCLSILCWCQMARGDLGVALSSSAQAVATAEEIHHHQWEIIAHAVSGLAAGEIFQLERARAHLEHALDLSLGIHSGHWIYSIIGYLTTCLIASGDLDAAEELLGRRLPPDTPAQTLGQRLAWCGRAELAIRQGKPALALEIVDRLVAASLNLGPGRVIIQPWMIRGEALTALGKVETRPAEHTRLLQAGEQALQDVLEEVLRANCRSRVWRIRMLLAENHAAQGRADATAEDRRLARQCVLDLANSLPDPALRRHFLERALA